MSTGLIAIIRGVTPEEAPSIAQALYDGGFRKVEVPLNSPDPFESIRLIRERLPEDCLVGAGTVLSPEAVEQAAHAGSQIIVSPNMDVSVIRETVKLGLSSYPGVATITEAFTALAAGATALKLFPGSLIGIEGMKAWSSVLPQGTELLPVGGVGAENLADWLAAGAVGAGIGGSLYRAGDDPNEVQKRAAELTRIWADSTNSTHGKRTS